jgi:hypothetical protein
MKKLLPFVLILIFTGLSYLDFSSNEKSSVNNVESFIAYKDGILKSELEKVSAISNYNINVELFPDEKKVVAEEKVIWINKTPFPTSEIQIHLYPNAYKNSKTLFAKGRGIEITEKTRSSVDFSEIKIGDKPGHLVYFQPEIDDKYDSTVAKIILDQQAIPGDTVRIVFKYSVSIPKKGKRFGYAADRNFFFISQWFPKVGVFENGIWICSQYHPFTNFYSDFGSYNVKITVPEKYLVAATGVNKNIQKGKNKKSVYFFSQSGIHDFAWTACDEFILQQSFYKRRDSSQVKIIAVLQPENEIYKDRFIQAVKNALQYFEKNIGIYPYKTITIVDAPGSSQSGGMEYPTLITTGATLFSPTETLEPESVTIHEFVHQYFYGIVANNEVYNAWLDEGITSYLEERIMEKYYREGLLHFNFLDYYPIFGLNFLSYNEIPLVYTLGNYTFERGAKELGKYYQSPGVVSILDTSYKFPNALDYSIGSYSKPELVLISLERFLGPQKIMNMLKDFYQEYKFKHPTPVNFLVILKKYAPKDFEWIEKNLFESSSSFDYMVKYVKKLDKSNEYEVFLERLGGGIFKLEIAFYTDKDTVFQQWDGQERWKKIFFKTENNLIGVEIDPNRKNILDLNYANNSYVIKKQYGGSTRLSFRFLFWFQNLLLILGSIS